MVRPRLVLAFVVSAAVASAQQRLDTEECTVGVACGKATEDGRPLLWKNRDAHQRDNVVMALADGKVPYFALCDAGSAAAVWGGANVAGFCVVTAVARDLPEGPAEGPDNGAFTKLALQRCRTLAEFEQLLAETADKRRTRGSFGVVDGSGGAAFFEVGPKAHQRFDAAAAEHGILVRTNFAVGAGSAGDGDGDERGRERFERATAICQLPQSKPLTHRFVLQQFLRDLQPPPSATKGDAGRQDTRETINRQTTVAGLVIAGVAPGTDPRWTTMWALLGQPLFTVAVPLFPAAGSVPLVVGGDPRSALCDASRRLQDAFYDAAPAGGESAGAVKADATPPLRWLRGGTELPLVRRNIVFAEADILARHEEALANWRTGGDPRPPLLRLYQDAMAKLALKHVRELAEQHAPAAAPKAAGK